MAIHQLNLLGKLYISSFIVVCIVPGAFSLVSLNMLSTNFSTGAVLVNLVNTLGGRNHEINYVSSTQLSPRTCPSDLLSVNSGNIVALGSIPPVILQSSPRCITTENLVAVHSYECIVEYEMESVLKAELVVFNILPDVQEVSFPRQTWRASVEEGSSGVLVSGLAGLVASSPKEDPFSPFQYRISPPNDKFSIVTETRGCVSIPILKTNQILIADLVNAHELTVEAIHSVYSNVRATANVTVIVVDVNDNPPVFVTVPTTRTIYNNVSIGYVVTTVEASDADSGLNGQVRYYFKTPQPHFTTNPFNGDILVSNDMQSLSDTQFNLTVVAQDGGQPSQSSEVNVTVEVEQATVHPPSINLTSTSVSIAEHSVTGRVVTVFTVTTQTTDAPSVSLVGYAAHLFTLFLSSTTVRSHVYELRVGADLDREMYKYGIRVIVDVKDGQNPTFGNSADLLVNLDDIDDNPPTFDQSVYYVTIHEGVPESVDILSPVVTDRDIGENAEMGFTVLDSSSYFKVNRNTSAIQTARSIPRGTIGTFTVTLTALGQGAMKHNTSVSVHIDIVGYNFNRPTFQDPPPPTSTPLRTFQPQATVTVSETAASDDVIYTFSATDPDSGCGGRVTYSIVHSSPPVVDIDQFTGQLFPKFDGSLDYEQFGFVYVTVRASDNGIPALLYSDSQLQINITSANDLAPVLDDIQCPCFLQEGANVRQFCNLNLSVIDGDIGENTRITFSIVGGNERGHFTIDSATGNVTTADFAVLDREVIDSYTLLISASDGLHSSNNVTLNIIVLDIDDNTISYRSASRSIIVPSNSKIGSTVASLAVDSSDIGFNGLVTYTTSGNFPSVFDVDPNTGSMVVVQSLPTTNVLYNFFVHAQDRLTSTTRQMSVRVTIGSPSLSPPMFSLSKQVRTIPQNLQTRSAILTISATLDSAIASDHTIVYSSEELPSVFTLHSTSGVLSLARALDVFPSVYTFTVNASISGNMGYTAQQTIEVTVYPPSTASGSATLTQPQGNHVCHYSGTVGELSNDRASVIQLDPTRNGQSLSYSLELSLHSSAFVVNGNNLDVNSGFAGLFDLEQRDAVYLTLVAYQGSSLFFRCAVTVGISDANNHPPVFPQTQYSVEMYSNSPVNSIVMNMQAVDRDSGANAVTRYSLQTASSVFQVDPNTGILKLSQLLSSQSTNMFTLRIIATDNGDSLLTSTATVTVTVLALSNTPPRVSSLPPQSVSEGITTGHTVASLPSGSSVDPDVGSHGTLKYCILGGNVGGYFKVASNGDVQVDRKLDYEGPRSSFSLQILIYDVSPNPQYAATSLTVNVLNVNERPTFYSSRYKAAVSEDAPSLAHVVTVEASDVDQNDQVVYSITAGNTNSHFTVNTQTGDIYISPSTTLDREEVSEYVLTVVARDSGALTATATVTINVVDVNDNSPKFENPFNIARLDESTEVGSIIYTVSAADHDEGVHGDVGYRVVSGNDRGLFSLDWESGRLKLLKGLDYEEWDTTPELMIMALDQHNTNMSSGLQVSSLFILLQDVNDNPPLFSKSVYFASVAESVPVESEVMQVEAVDGDNTSNSVTYSLLGENSGDFTITSTGVVKNAVSLDRERLSKYNLLVTAQDAGSPRWTSTAAVQIVVEDENDNPPVLESSYTLKIPENYPLNIPFYFIRADDDDSGDNADCTYTITSGDQDVWGVHSHFGFLYLKRELDYETAHSHSFAIRARNTLPPGDDDQATVTIRVLDVDENSSPPRFLSNTPLVVSVAADSGVGTVVTNLTAVDPNFGRDGTVLYSVLGGSGVRYFNIDRESGILTVSSQLPIPPLLASTLHIEAEDNSTTPHSSNVHILVSISPSSLPLQFTSPLYKYSVTEGSPSGTYVGFVSIAGNSRDNVTYAVVDGNTDNTFALNSTSGVLSVAGNVRRVSNELYQLEVSASNSHFSSHSLVSISVLDLNDHRPIFEPSTRYSVDILNNYYEVRPTVPVFRILARDLDEPLVNGRITYRASSGTNGMFAVASSGDLSVVSSLSSTTAGPHSVTITATDSGEGNLATTGTVEVTIFSPSGSSASPEFSSEIESVHVPEDTSIGDEVVYTTTATDSDSTNLMFRILDSSSPSTTSLQHFALHPNTATLYVAGHLDRETVQEYTLQIEVWDGYNSDTFQLTITVSDVNDNPPRFSLSQYTFTVSEVTSSSICCIAVSDDDEGSNGNVTMTIVDSTGEEGVFILSADGRIQLQRMLNRETVSEHSLTIVGRDGGSPSLISYTTVKVTVSDINDNEPQFPKDSYKVTVNESTPIGTSIVTLSAFDPDSGQNGQVSYSLQPLSSVFSINTTTGVLSLSSQLAFSDQQVHRLTAVASDGGSTVKSSSVTISVQVLTNFTSPPRITSPGGVTIMENLPSNTYVTSVSADNPVPVYYTLTDVSGSFWIDSSSGVVRTSTKLDRESTPTHTLTATVHHAVGFGATGTVTFTVSVSNENDNAPRPVITGGQIKLSISESFTPSTSTAFTVQLIDADEDGNNNEVDRVAILDPVASQHLQINTFGRGTLLKRLDVERGFNYRDFLIAVSDDGTESQMETYHVHLEVVEANDESPVFSPPQYSAVLWTPAKLDTTVLHVSATDKDGDDGGVVRYSLTGGNGTTSFDIDATSGEITLGNPFNLQPYYHLQVTASDEGLPTLSSTADVYISMKKCPILNFRFDPSDYTLTVPENTQEDAVILSPNFIHTGYPIEAIQFSLIADESGLFAVDGTSGNVTLVAPLDREKSEEHGLTLQAVHRSDSSLIADLSLQVIVEDVNDNPPFFINAPYETYISNNASTGDPVVRVSANDPDLREGGRIAYRIISGGLGYFTLDGVTGELTVRTPLSNLQTGRVISVTVEARDHGVPVALTNTTIVSIFIVDSQAPVFVNSLYRANVSELATVGTLVTTVSATVRSSSGFPTYTIESGDDQVQFTIDFYNGEVSVQRALDYELKSVYKLRLKVSDPTLDTTSFSRANLTISILDENDQRPVFTSSIYSEVLPEDSALGSMVTTVTATDRDSENSPNSQIMYDFPSDFAFREIFSVASSSGVVTVIGAMDYETTPLYEIPVLAIDGGSPSLTGTTTIRLSVTNVNDNAPQFSLPLFELSVQETAHNGSIVGSVSASDLDNDVVSYVISGGNEDGLFTIDPQAGEIRLRLTQSRLTIPVYNLTVSANDGVYSGNTTVRITVVDINDNAPVFTSQVYHGNVSENHISSVSVLQVSATDADRGGATLTYDLNDEVPFEIDASTGWITKRYGAIDREETPDFEFYVFVRDDVFTSSAVVRVRVLDVNDNNPSLDSQTTIQVREDLEISSIVTTLSSTDPDEGDNSTVTYQIGTIHSPSNVNRNSLPFYFRSESTGELILRSQLNYETTQEFSFDLIVSDRGSPRRNTTVTYTIQVLDTNDSPPVFQQSSYSFSAIEPSNDDLPVGQVTASVPDGSLILYRLLSSTAQFSIHSRTGEITLRDRLDRETKAEYEFVVEATNVAGIVILRALASVSVTVLDVNDNNPSFVDVIFLGQVLENQDPRTQIVRTSTSLGPNTIETEDPDAGENGTVSYEVVERDVPFIVDSSGRILTTIRLNREGANPRYTFDVRAIDQGAASLTSTNSLLVIVDVTDVNDNSPVFNATEYRAEVDEDAESNHVLITVFANDSDSGNNARITFSLHGSSDFTINSQTGAVSVASVLDHERHPVYNLTVDGYDGANRASVSLYITVLDVNDEPPVFNSSQYTSTVEENSDISTSLLTVYATDVDVVGSITYSLLSGPSRDNFTINSTSGELFLVQNPDYEAGQQLDVQVVASDGVHETLASVTIHIMDRNDVHPSFTSVSFSAGVYENRDPGTNVVRVSARDSDSGLGGLLQYKILSGNVGSMLGVNSSNLPFSIAAQSGLILTTAKLDREQVDTYTLYIEARDLGDPSLSSTTQVVVTVLDTNDHSPVFERAVYDTSVSESIDQNALLLTVRANDEDSGSNAQLFYELESGDNAVLFAMDSQSGHITVNGKLDFETQSSFNLTVVAHDGGLVSMSGSAVVLIEIIDENDNRPIFQQKNYLKIVREDFSVGSMIEQVEAHDRDIDINAARVIYAIAEEDELPQFFIDPDTGVITVGAQLDYELQEEYQFRVLAFNEGSELRDTATVTVTLRDVNDEDPVFNPPNAVYTVSENVGSPVLLGILSATDPDSVTDPNDITFRLQVSTYSNRFSLDRDGVLKTQVTFDREEKEKYRLVITADDGGTPPQTGTTTVTVVIGDVNDNDPKPAHADIFIYLLPGHYPSVVVGQVNANDPDILNNHVYSLLDETSSEMGPFLLHSSNGSICAPDNPPIGRFSFAVNVTENRKWARCTVAITVSEISRNMTDNSITVRISQTSARDFLQDKRESFTSTDIFRIDDSMLPPFVLGVQDVLGEEDTTDVSFSVEDGKGSFIGQDLLRHLVHVNRASLAGIKVKTELYDLCAREPCGSNGICENVMSRIHPQLVSHSPEYTIVSPAPEWDYKCKCLPGTTGRNCDVGVVDYCAQSPCIPPMKCVSNPEDKRASCACPTGSYLKDGICSVNQTACSSFGCLNNGSCEVTVDGLVCVCGSKFTGPKCQIGSPDRFACNFFGCQNGTCTTSHAGTTCTCFPGYSGIQCQNEEPNGRSGGCSTNPCQYGGTCNNGGEYTCVCPEGYSGQNCEVYVYGGPVATDSCEAVRCPNDEDCVQDSQGNATCVDFCFHNPCLHGGECVRQHPGLACNCSLGYFGSRCEVSLGRFYARGYAVFPSIHTPLNSSIYLEFAALSQSPYGLLFLNGRFDDEFSDFVVLEMIQGRLKYSLSRGGERTDVEFSERDLADGEWHSVVAGFNLTHMWLTVDDCTNTGVSYGPLGRVRGPLEPLICSQSVKELPGSHVSLDVTGPLLLGYHPTSFNYTYGESYTFTFQGFMRNFIVGGRGVDFSNPIEKADFFSSLELDGGSCSSEPCQNEAECVPDGNGYTCLCGSSFTGKNCEKVSSSVSFPGDTSITYTILTSGPTGQTVKRQTGGNLYSTQNNLISLGFSTSNANGTLLAMVGPTDYAYLELNNGYLQLRFNLGLAEAVARITAVPMNDGTFYDVELRREGRTAELSVNRQFVSTATVPGTDRTLNIFQNGIYLGAASGVGLGDGAQKVDNSFNGCIRGVILDGKQLPMSEGQVDENFDASYPPPSSSVSYDCWVPPSGPIVPPPSTPLPLFIIIVIALVAVLVIAIVLCVGIIIVTKCRLNGLTKSTSGVFEMREMDFISMRPEPNQISLLHRSNSGSGNVRVYDHEGGGERDIHNELERSSSSSHSPTLDSIHSEQTRPLTTEMATNAPNTEPGMRTGTTSPLPHSNEHSTVGGRTQTSTTPDPVFISQPSTSPSELSTSITGNSSMNVLSMLTAIQESRSQGGKEPPKTAVAREPPKTTVAREPPKTAVAREPPKTAVAREPPKTAVTRELPKTAVAREPPKTAPKPVVMTKPILKPKPKVDPEIERIWKLKKAADRKVIQETNFDELCTYKEEGNQTPLSNKSLESLYRINYNKSEEDSSSIVENLTKPQFSHLQALLDHLNLSDDDMSSTGTLESRNHSSYHKTPPSTAHPHPPPLPEKFHSSSSVTVREV